jgi:serine/threonine protein kinase
MVDKYGHVYLIDFGASKHIEQNSTLTTSLALAYTRGYCPPELAELTYGSQADLVKALKDIGPWTDIYALGATMYNLLTDSIPPSSNRLYKDGSNAFVFSGTLSSSIQNLIIWMMKPNREDRPQSVSEITIELHHSSEKTIVENREAEKSRDNENASSIFSDKEWERYYEKKKNPQRQEYLKQKGRQKKSNAYSSKGLFMLLGALVSIVLVIIIAVYHIEIPLILLVLLLVSPGILLVAGFYNLNK